MKRLKSLICFLILFAFTFLYWQITWRTNLGEISFVYYCFASLSFVFGGMALYSSKNERLIRRLFFYLTFIYFVTAITSIVGLNAYPLATREFGRGSTYDTSLDFEVYKDIYRKMNIASWSQMYGMLFAVPVSLMAWRQRKNPFYIVLCILLIWAVIASQLTFAVLLTLVFIVAMNIPRGKNDKTIIFMLVLLLVTGVILIDFDFLLSLAVDISKDAGFSFLTVKLNDLKILLLEGKAVGDAGARRDLYQTSLNTFFQNPLFGLIADGRATPGEIGFHSEFFDIIGSVGIAGLIIIVTMFIGYGKFLLKIKGDMQRDLLIILIGFIVLFIVNPVFNSPQIFMGAFFYPLISSRYCSFEKKGKRAQIDGIHISAKGKQRNVCI